MSKHVTIVGGGPGGLFAAYWLLKNDFEVDLYDQMSGVGKKFLVAGHGGLNLTHSEDLTIFHKRYGKNQVIFEKLLNQFSPENLREWCYELGVETFVGSSGRVFPKKFKAAELLIFWLNALKAYKGFHLRLKHQLVDITNDNNLTFKVQNETKTIIYRNVIFSLGGASWSKTGSDGKWAALFKAKGIGLAPFKAMNCGFECTWSSFLKTKVETAPIKNITLTISGKKLRGEILLTQYGVEGGAIYALSSEIREQIEKNGHAIIEIDFMPDVSIDQIKNKLNSPRGKSTLSNYLRKTLNIDKTTFLLLMEKKIDLNRDENLQKLIKSYPLVVNNPRPLDEAISTSGGILFNEVDQNLMLRKMPNCYAVGEMLDWEAQTGGYLLQGCFSMAYHVAQSIIRKEK